MYTAFCSFGEVQIMGVLKCLSQDFWAGYEYPFPVGCGFDWVSMGPNVLPWRACQIQETA